MPCLFSKNLNINHEKSLELNSSNNSNDCLINSLNNLDLSNPFNIIATITPISTSTSSSLNNLNYNYKQINEEKNNYFEPLPFSNKENQLKQINYPQLSQKHTIIKQMIARKTKQNYNNYQNLFSSKFHRKKQQICTFCKSNGESFNVYTSHVLRNINNEIECPILMAYVCPKCGATGKLAHTIKYCTALSEYERISLPTVKLFKEGRTSSGNMNLFKK